MSTRQHPVPMELTPGHIYQNAGGGTFRCISAHTPVTNKNRALVQNVKSGWTCIAIGTIMYDDGTIEWDYSIGGGFRPLSAEEVTK